MHGVGGRGSWHNADPPSDNGDQGYDESMENSASNRKRLLSFDSELKSNWDMGDRTRSLIASPTCLIAESCIVAIILLVIAVAYIRRGRRRLASMKPSLSGNMDLPDLEDQRLIVAAEDPYSLAYTLMK
ncbi:hypothetical protein EDD18DRAFT_1358030 [Armillaria luteobubalina]|uniref:Uncharacterized protein n=1 Tax=Armillaria luteobubalina TaxID=153913 RepID=A0AA39UPZ6_9AGAR|nr:hypothetical protein EDD18DRAFT_1358030 [Armillaria luteobubalina]